MSPTLKTLFALAVAAGLTVGCQKAGEETGGMNDEEAAEAAAPDTAAIHAALQASNEQWIAAAKAGDAAAMTALYTDDAVIVAPGGGGPAGTAVASMLAATSFDTMELSIDHMGVASSGDLAWASGPYHDTGTLADGTAFDATGRYGTVFRKVGDGWKIVFDAWDENAPAE